MAKTGNISGTITVGETGDPDVSKALSMATPTIDQQSSGQITTTENVASTTIPMGAVADAKMVRLKFHDGAGGARLVVVTVTKTSGTAILPECSELIFNSGSASLTSKFVSMTFATPATPTGAYVCDFVVAGDD